MIYLNHGFIVRFFVLFLQPAKFFERVFESEDGSAFPLKLPLPSRPSVPKPRPARILGGRNPTYTFCFSFFESPRRKNLVKRKKVCVGLPPSPRGGGGGGGDPPRQAGGGGGVGGWGGGGGTPQKKTPPPPPPPPHQTLLFPLAR